MKYNSFVISCKTDMYYTCMYNAGAGYKVKNHGNNGLAILHGNFSS